MNTDIIIVGAGPAGLAFARQFKDSNLSLTIIEKAPLSVLQNPPFDGREIALTHKSRDIMQELSIWDRINPDEIYRLRDAKVFNGNSDYTLHFPQPSKGRAGPTDRLGYFISNHNIRRASYEAVTEMDNVQILTDISVKSVATNKDEALAYLDNGEVIHGKLLIAADSRLSQTRRQLGISADMHDFSRTVIVFRAKHTLSNQHTACECFHYGRTLALLPLEEHLTSCVITIDNTRAHEILDLTPEELARDVQQQLKGMLGDMEVVSSVTSYPLMAVHANKFYGTRCALIGDAAVGMHPVTAHGYNLGLASVETLARLILKAEQRGKDIASEGLLQEYNLKHQLHTRPLYHGTNAVVTVFTSENQPAKLLRSAIIRISDNLPPLKKIISKQLTG